MQTIDAGKIVYIDVDDTLISWEKPFDSDDIYWINKSPFYVNNALVERIKRLKARGFYIVIWSQAGGDWARDVVGVLCLDECVDLCITKPLYVIDDLPPEKWMKRAGIDDPKGG